MFAFVEGALVTALKEGRWILFDEINLAPAETLERLSGVLESAVGSVVLAERGDERGNRMPPAVPRVWRHEPVRRMSGNETCPPR